MGLLCFNALILFFNGKQVMVIHFCCIVLMGKSNDHAFVVRFDELLLVIVVGKKWMMMMNHIIF